MYGMGVSRMGSVGGVPSLAAQIAAMFGQGQQGAWYDPSDFTTLFQDSAGTTPVTAFGQPVGLMRDKSGRGNHASQATAASRPTLRQDAGGRYYLEFDGVDDSMATAAINFSASDKITIWTGARNNVAGMVAELSANAGLNAGAFYLYAGSDAGFNGWNSLATGTAAVSATQSAGVNVSMPDTAVLSISHDIAGSLSTIRRNSVAGTSGVGAKGTGNFGNYPLFIGRRGGASAPFNGNMYSLIIRGTASSASEIVATERYVASKTGVTL